MLRSPLLRHFCDYASDSLILGMWITLPLIFSGEEKATVAFELRGDQSPFPVTGHLC
jgi:hypothetical protein